MEKIDLTKCNNCRFRAKVDGKEKTGSIQVIDGCIKFWFDHHNELNDIIHHTVHLEYYRLHGIGDFFDDFEIVPRDPETYKDWQVGDKVHYPNGDNDIVIFRSGELVVLADNFTEENSDVTAVNTCSQLFDRRDGRLVLTDIEQQIIEEKKRYEPQDGDICYVEGKTDYQTIFISAPGSITSYYVSYGGPGSEMHLSIKKLAVKYSVMDDKSVKILRPATEDEKQKLFDAMANEGKRWNAEKKVVEDIPKPHEFKKGEPVLVRTEYGRDWKLSAYVELSSIPDATFGKYGVTDGRVTLFYRFCLPYNERTMHLLGTGEDYKEGE